MRILLSGASAVALTVASISVAGATQCTTAGGMMGHGMMPHCTPASGPVVWYLARTKLFYVKGSPQYGKGSGVYLCRATAVARGGHPGRSMMGGSHGSMGGSHGSMGGSHGSMGGSHPMPGSATPSSAMPGSMTMAPRPTAPAGNTPGPGLPNSTNAAPGSQGSPMPSSSGNPTSGNQGNTGAPGAGGQVPNNPASSSNSNPNPQPSPRPSPRP